ncbi:hypothetical protein [Streptacidiphilus sp. EB129]|jgi:hypothetical protein|uniref:hypothetical protein n=1 Tax=Streptacidiphilus sp. EB129 TaxID=3156262 RepID=UPI003514DA1E
MRPIRHVRHEFWWWAEQHAGHLWDRVCRDGVSCWLDWLPAYCTGQRYAAQNALTRGR